MFAVLAIIAFVIALIFHLAGGSVATYVLAAELIGLICVACHLAFGIGWSWARQGPRGPQA
jgi:hypothetical protein